MKDGLGGKEKGSGWKGVREKKGLGKMNNFIGIQVYFYPLFIF